MDPWPSGGWWQGLRMYKSCRVYAAGSKNGGASNADTISIFESDDLPPPHLTSENRVESVKQPTCACMGDTKVNVMGIA
jgi:hypothetical protein